MRHRLSFALIGAAFWLLGQSPRTADAATIEVGPDRPITSPLYVPWSNLAPGDHVILNGVFRTPVVITSQGTAAQPIVVTGAPGSAVEGSIVLEGARHVVLDHVTVRGSKLSGIILRRGAEADTVQNSAVIDSALGIWIGDGALGSHRLIGNLLKGNKTHGIAIDRTNASPGHETLISGNRVTQNAIHGMEINGNYYIVEHNVVDGNGYGMSGASGIHTYAKDAGQDAGKHNIIRYNISFGNIDPSGQDGNGIQLDQWCDDNQVYFNLAFENDGGGITVFDAANNRIYNNTLYGNMRDPGRSHAYKADLIVASDFTKKTDHSFGNVIVNNLVYATRPGRYAIYVDPFSAKNTKEIAGNNLVQADSQAPIYFWNGVKGRDLAEWNRMKPGGADLSTDPMFVDPGTPLPNGAQPSGFALRPGSPVARVGLATPSPATRDLAGASIARPPIGAFGVSAASVR